MMILNGNIWVCTLGNGLFKINLDDKSIIIIKILINKLFYTK